METVAMATVLTCDAEHVYRLGNERIWGVSEVLRDNRLVDDRWFDESSRSRGTAVHAILADAARGFAPDFDLIDPDLHGWVRSGLLWLDHSKVEVLSVELMRHSALYRFAGTMDLYARWQGYEWVFDYKTGKAAKATRFQMGAYAMLLPQTTTGLPIKKAALELHEDGSRATPIFYNTPEHYHDGNRFLSYLNTSRDRQLFGPKGE